jgi:hypothetical protein
MNQYKVEFWFRYGKMEKDFDTIELQADTEEEVVQIIRDLKKWVFKITILEINGVKITTV